jgi:hypothetical protein
LRVGVEKCGLGQAVPVLTELPGGSGVTHLVAVERVGPSHTPRSIREQTAGDPEALGRFLREIPQEHHDRCHNMRGRDVTAHHGDLAAPFEVRPQGLTTIGIGDGGNEVGMGKVPWDVVRRNIPDGGRIACRVPTDHLIVAGVSNWGAYALAAGVRLLRGAPHDPGLWDVEGERELLELLVERGPLVDGTTGRQIAQVDGLPFHRYAEVLDRLGHLLSIHS